MNKPLKACQDCKHANFDVDYDIGFKTFESCGHSECFKAGEFNPITGVDREIRITDFGTLNETGDCPHYEKQGNGGILAVIAAVLSLGFIAYVISIL